MNSDTFRQDQDSTTSSNDEIPDDEWLQKVPKTDLHCHLGGSLRISTLIDEAQRQKIELPSYDEEELRRHVVKDEAESLTDYLSAFALTESVMRDPRALRRVAYELAEDAYRENVKVLEMRYAPTNYQSSSFKLYHIVESVLEGIEQAQRDFDMLVGLIICGLKHDRQATEEAVQLAVAYKRSGVLGFDLAGPEYGHPPKDFAKIMKPVFKNFIPVTIHAGEAYGAKSIADSVIHLNARRIGHATSLFQFDRLTNYIEITGLGLELCLSSNVHTNAIPSVQTHPIRQMMREGLRFSLNTDNRLVSNTDITNEMRLLVNELGFKKGDIIKMVKGGVKSSFFRKSEKRWALDQMDEELGLKTATTAER